jgi:hypothetical protein
MPRRAVATGDVGEGGSKVEPTAATGVWEIPNIMPGRYQGEWAVWSSGGVRGTAFSFIDRGSLVTYVRCAGDVGVIGTVPCYILY